MIQEKPKASFVTFYSFKGGVGRSMALINTAGNLAGRGFRVLVVDLDLEAPGLSYLNPDAPDPSLSNEKQKELFFQLGFVDLLSDAKTRGKEADLFALSAGDLASRYTQTYHLPKELREFPDGSLQIMPAGKFDGSYAQRFDALNLRELYQEGTGEPLIRAFKKKLAEADLYDYVLVDSRTGFSDEAGICTRDLADYLVILSGLNRQNVEGTSEFLKALRIAKGEKEANFTIILSPVPNGEDALLDEREKMAKQTFERAWGGHIDLSLQIPYHPQLALTEEPHIFRRRRGHLFDAYRAIERHLLAALGHDAWHLQSETLELLRSKAYLAALRNLWQMVRLDGGGEALSNLSIEITVEARRAKRSKTIDEGNKEESLLSTILKDDLGRKVVEFIIEHLRWSEREWGGRHFLDHLIRSDKHLAKNLFNRFLKAAPDNPDLLFSYASFQEIQYANFDEADLSFKRAIEIGPTNTYHFGHYAIFLERKRNKGEAAEALYKKLFECESDPSSLAMHYCNYGQLLVGLGRLSEAEKPLLLAWNTMDLRKLDEVAETCIALWFAVRMQGIDGTNWERVIKFCLEHPFNRPEWEFNRIFKQAVKILENSEIEYARALTDVFLDFDKLPNLQRFERWNKIKSLEPSRLKLMLKEA